jgi:hypothetical protein
MKKTLAVLAASGMALAASADTLVLDITGWATFAGYGHPNNSSSNIALPVGTTIDSASYVVDFTAEGFSWRSEFVLSLNDGPVGAFFDHAPGFGIDTSGNFVGSGNFGSPPGGWAGGPFVLTTGDLFITVYETFDDGGTSTRDAIVNSGRIVVNYTIPAPGSLALLGLAGLAARRRR